MGHATLNPGTTVKSIGTRAKDVVAALDRRQQSTPWLGFPYAVAKKFGEDNAGYLASLVAYYGFFSLFPLLLVFVTVLGFVLGGPSSQHILNNVVRQVPLIGNTDVHALRGNGVGLVVGIVFTLLAGIGVIQALQYGMDELWGVPVLRRPNFLISRLRAFLMLGVLGASTLLATALSGLASAGSSISPAFRLAGPVASLGVNVVVLVLAFRLLTMADVSWRDVLPGAVAAAIALTMLQFGGSLYASHVLKNAGKTYGAFAAVIALLSWIYLGAQLTFYAAEINVVKAKRLWPRSMVTEPTEADRRAMAGRAREQQRRADEDVDVEFHSPHPHRRRRAG